MWIISVIGSQAFTLLSSLPGIPMYSRDHYCEVKKTLIVMPLVILEQAPQTRGPREGSMRPSSYF